MNNKNQSTFDEDIKELTDWIDNRPALQYGMTTFGALRTLNRIVCQINHKQAIINAMIKWCNNCSRCPIAYCIGTSDCLLNDGGVSDNCKKLILEHFEFILEPF